MAANAPQSFRGARRRGVFSVRAQASPPPGARDRRLGKASGWPRQNRRNMSAVHGPTPFTATSARCASSASCSASALEIERAARDRLGDRAERPDFCGGKAGAAQNLFACGGKAGGVQRDDRPLKSPEYRASARDRDLLRDDDRREAGESRFAAPERRRPSDGDELLHKLRVFCPKPIRCSAKRRFVRDRRARMIDPGQRFRPPLAPRGRFGAACAGFALMHSLRHAR